MPTLFRSGKVMIRMFADDHDPPHFHIITPDMEMVIAMSDFSTMKGHVRKRDYEVAMLWARGNVDLLWRRWDELNG
jgi:hypothetical protein